MPQRPKTLEQKLNEGDARKVGKRNLLTAIENHMKSPPGPPRRPGNLSHDQVIAWNQMMGELEKMNFDFGTADGFAVEGCAMAVGDARAARAAIRALEREIEAQDKAPKNLADYIRWVHAMERLESQKEHLENKERKAWETFLKFSDRIGALHPMGRQKIPTMRAGPSDLASLLSADDESAGVN